jgi:hypothetical protein
MIIPRIPILSNLNLNRRCSSLHPNDESLFSTEAAPAFAGGAGKTASPHNLPSAKFS